MKPTMKKTASLLLALFIAVCSGDDDSTAQGDFPAGSVDVSGTSVTLTCPLKDIESDTGSTKWKYNKAAMEADGNVKLQGDQMTFKTYSSANNGLYKCTAEPEKHYYFYVKARVCDSCVEVEVVQVIGIIFADLLVTAGVAILVYYWAQNRKGASAMAPARPGRQNRAPPVPNPDYEPIRTGNREVYSGLNKRT